MTRDEPQGLPTTTPAQRQVLARLLEGPQKTIGSLGGHLHTKGLVEWDRRLWRITEAGRRALAQGEAASHE